MQFLAEVLLFKRSDLLRFRIRVRFRVNFVVRVSFMVRVRVEYRTTYPYTTLGQDSFSQHFQ
jgi:hypothetical protein